MVEEQTGQLYDRGMLLVNDRALVAQRLREQAAAAGRLQQTSRDSSRYSNISGRSLEAANMIEQGSGDLTNQERIQIVRARYPDMKYSEVKRKALPFGSPERSRVVAGQREYDLARREAEAAGYKGPVTSYVREKQTRQEEQRITYARTQRDAFVASGQSRTATTQQVALSTKRLASAGLISLQSEGRPVGVTGTTAYSVRQPERPLTTVQPAGYIPAGSLTSRGSTLSKDLPVSQGFADKLSSAQPVLFFTDEQGRVTIDKPYIEKYGGVARPPSMISEAPNKINVPLQRVKGAASSFVSGFLLSRGSLDYDSTRPEQQFAGAAGATFAIATVGSVNKFIKGYQAVSGWARSTRLVQAVTTNPVVQKTGLTWLGVGVARASSVAYSVKQIGFERAYRSYGLGEKGYSREDLKKAYGQSLAYAESTQQSRIARFGGGLSIFLTPKEPFETSASAISNNDPSFVRAASQARSFAAVGEIGGYLAAGATGEQSGRSFVSGWIASLERNYPKIVSPVSKRFSRAATTFAFPIMKAGVVEGVSVYAAETVARQRRFSAPTALMYAGVGGLSAGIVGGLIGGTAGLRPAFSKKVNFAANIIDPYEKPGDIISDFLPGPRTRVPVTTLSPTGTLTISTRSSVPASSMTQGGTNVPTSINTRSPVSIPVLSSVPTGVPSIIPTLTPTTVPTSTTVPSMIPSIIPTGVPTGVPSMIPSIISTTIPTTVPTPVTFPRIPLFPFGPSAGSFSKRGSQGFIGGGKKAYNPSLYARFFGITASEAPSGPFSGLEIRPLLSPRSSKSGVKQRSKTKKRKR